MVICSDVTFFCNAPFFSKANLPSVSILTHIFIANVILAKWSNWYGVAKIILHCGTAFYCVWNVSKTKRIITSCTAVCVTFERRPRSQIPTGTNLWQVQSCFMSHRNFTEVSGNKLNSFSLLEHAGDKETRNWATWENAESMNSYRTEIEEQCQGHRLTLQRNRVPDHVRYYGDVLWSWPTLFRVSKELAKLVPLLTCTLDITGLIPGQETECPDLFSLVPPCNCRNSALK
jgi:hypothetical protein